MDQLPNFKGKPVEATGEVRSLMKVKAPLNKG